MADQPVRTRWRPLRHPLRSAGGLALLLLSAMAVAQPSPPATSDAFAAAMAAAMAQMHHGMAMPYSGDPDRDFAAMMIPHHQGAIDMARIELRYGHDERLRRLAQGIVVEQQQEIVVMQQILASLPPAASASPNDMPAHSDKEP